MAQQWWTLTATQGLDERSQPTVDGARGYALEAENLGFSQAGAFVARLGMKAQSLTSSGITGIVEWLGKFVTNAGVEELWAVSNNAGTANLARRASGTWSGVTFSDTVTVANLRYMSSAALNGKLFLAYDSNANRLHVWDGTSLRRVGVLKPSAAPTVADTGAGAYAATARRYRVQFVIMSGSDVVAASELSDASSTFTPSGAGSAARVTRPTTPDSATHWRVFAIAGATDTYSSYQQISGDIAVATTTYDDSTAPASYSGALPASIGTYYPPPSAKYLATDGLRLVMANGWESSASSGEITPKPNRVWWTPVLGASDIGDDERVPVLAVGNRNYADAGNAGPITGLVGPLFGDFYVFKADSIYKLTFTGDAFGPTLTLLTDAVGAIDQRSICYAENGEGIPCIYFASRTGVYQITGGGIREISEPIRRDLRLSNFSAATSFLGWDPLEKTLFVQTSSAAADTQGTYHQFAFDVASDRWTGLSIGGLGSGWILGRSILGVDTYLSSSGQMRCALSALDSDGVPRLLIGGQTTAAAGAIYAYGAQAGLDGSEVFVSRLRVRAPLGLAQGSRFSVGAPTVIYRNPSGTTSTTATLTVSYIREDGDSITQSQTLTATDADDPLDQQRLTFEGLQAADCFVIDVRLSLSYTASFTTVVPPAIDAVWVPFTMAQELAA